MEKFTASDGVTLVRKRGSGEIEVGRGGTCWAGISEEFVPALHEFFLHERDQELGRWRWPENPDYVVYPIEVAGHTGSDYRECAVLDESTGLLQEYGSDLPICHGGQSREAARAYFAAHPEPKPWHEAKPGEVWVLTLDGADVAALYLGGDSWKYGPEGLTVYHPGSRITEARRIWPEEKK